MSRFTLTVDTDNAAFDEDAAGELVRVLRLLADALEADCAPEMRSGGTVRDANGNTCGRWSW